MMIWGGTSAFVFGFGNEAISMRRSVFCAVQIFALFATLAVAQDRGLEFKIKELGANSADIGKQYAVFIAINRYKHWLPLRNPVKDAQEIRKVLEQKYYVDEIIELYDDQASKSGIIRLFSHLIETTLPQDSVLIFYAGHGYLDELSDTGFWIPVDGGKDPLTQENWLTNSQIRGFIGKIKARHIVLVSDSCFSGDILNPSRGMVERITERYFRKAYARISRQVLTSGASESVPDESPFARQLKLALLGNNKPYLDTLMIYNQVRLGVPDTTPLFGNLKGCGHQEGSSFIFFLKEETGIGKSEEIQENEAPKTTFTLVKAYGSLKVEARTPGKLFIDGSLQGSIPVGTVARIDNLETGSHELEIRYDDNKRESKKIEIEKDSIVSVSFSYVKPVQINVVPFAQINIDGKFDDWSETPPIFIDAIGDKRGLEKGLDIKKAYLAQDAGNLYMRFDIEDDDINSARLDEAYRFVIEVQRRVWVNVETRFNTRSRRWVSQITIWDGNKNDGTDICIGHHRIVGKSLEARYRLSAFSKYVKKGSSYRTSADTCYDEDGKWFQADVTEYRSIQF